MPDPIHDPSQNDPAARPLAVPQVWLVASGSEILVAPAGPAAPVFDPFPLPPVPKSLGDWLAILCEDFWREQRRCLGTVLLLDPHKRAWRPAIPAQRCARDAACWSLRRDDQPGEATTPQGAGLSCSRTSSRTPPAAGTSFTCRRLPRFTRSRGRC